MEDLFHSDMLTGSIICARVGDDDDEDEDENRLNGCEYCEMVVIEIRRCAHNKNVFRLLMIYLEDLHEAQTPGRTVEMYHLQVCPGDPLVVCPGSSVEFNALKNGLPRHKAEVDKYLVRSGGSKQDIEAKYEAYMDPTVAALAEVKGRVTRNQFYQEIAASQ